MADPVSLEWDHGRARLAPVGAMLTDVAFRLPDGREVEPMHRAPWLDEGTPNIEPPLLAHLQGEWPCVPFGAAPEAGLAGDWAGLPVVPEPWPHGYASNHPWKITGTTPGAAQAEIVYPHDHPIARLERSVHGQTGAARIELSLTVHPRQSAALPIGLHPVFRLPTAPGGARLRLGGHDRAWVYPGDTGGATPFRPGDNAARVEALQTSPPIDPTRLPYAVESESLLLLTGTDGTVALDNEIEGYRVRLEWDEAAFPSLMLWISNRGRQAPPWNGRHLALGVEPVASAFDLGTEISRRSTPLSAAGVPTTQPFEPGVAWTTRYSISAEAL